MRRAYGLVLFCVLRTAAAESPDRLEMMTITVTVPAQERQLPLAVATVRTDDDPAPNRQSLQDLLAPVPGLFMLNQDNAAQGLRLSIRGFGSRAAFGVRGVQVLLDGVPMTLPDGQTELDAIDLDQVATARVVRGPSAALFGNAAGGALLLRSRPPPDEESADADLQAGRYGGRRLRLQAGMAGLQGSLLVNRNEGFRRHAETASELVNLQWQRATGAGELSARLSTLDITADDPGGLTRAQADADRRAARPQNLQFDAGEHIRQQRISLNLQSTPGAWSTDATLFAGQRAFENRLPFTGGGQVQFRRHFGGLGLSASRQLDRHRVSFGLDTQLQRDDRQRYDNNNGQRGSRTLDQLETAFGLGLFARDTVAFARDWEASVGLRHDLLQLEVDDAFLADGDDSGDRNIRDWSLDASLARWFRDHYLYARFATSFETPTINELANPAGGGFNPALDSTRALNYELGMRGDYRSGRVSATVYRTDVEDELLPYELPAQPGRTFYRNAGETRRHGLELSAHWDASAHWQLQASLNLARYRFHGGALEENRLPGLPERDAQMALQHRRGALRSALVARHVGALYADDANTARVGSHVLLGLQTAWQPGPQTTVRLGIDNLLDRDYYDNVRINAFGGRYFEPAGGRAYRVSVRLAY